MTSADAGCRAIERILCFVQAKLAKYQEKGGKDKGGKAGRQERAEQPHTGRSQHGEDHDELEDRRGAHDRPERNERRRGGGKPNDRPQSDDNVVAEKDAVIGDLRETVEILQLKVDKLEQLIKLKNSKIDGLNKKVDQLSY